MRKMKIRQIYELVSDNQTSFSIEEDFKYLTIKFSVDSLKLVDTNQVKTFVKSLPEDNRISLIYMIGNEVEYSCNLRDENCVKELNEDLLDTKEDPDLQPPHDFQLIIHKKKKNNKFNIYDLNAFAEFLNKLTISELLSELSSCKGNTNGIIFNLIQDTDNLRTQTFVFSNLNFDDEFDFDFYRDSIVEKGKYNINRNGGNLHDFLPDDFYLVKRSQSELLNKIFDKLCMVLCLTYLSNYSEIFSRTANYKIVGYKTINIEIELDTISDISTNTLKSFYQMYTWVYESETPNISDKCGICRNILSLYLNSENVCTIDDDLYSYALSCNEIYLKENVDKYIEVKGNVINLLNDLNVKLLDTSKTFSNKLRNNLMALITFYFSTLLMNTISTGAINNIFTKDIATISYAFILCSLVYYFISLTDYRHELERYKKFYMKQKKFYGDVLIEKEIQDIFMNDQPYNDDLKEIKWAGIKYSALWFISVVVAIGVIIYLSGVTPWGIIKEILVIK